MGSPHGEAFRSLGVVVLSGGRTERGMNPRILALSDEGVALVRSGEVRVESKENTLDLLTGLQTNENMAVCGSMINTLWHYVI